MYNATQDTNPLGRKAALSIADALGIRKVDGCPVRQLDTIDLESAIAAMTDDTSSSSYGITITSDGRVIRHRSI